MIHTSCLTPPPLLILPSCPKPPNDTPFLSNTPFDTPRQSRLTPPMALPSYPTPPFDSPLLPNTPCDTSLLPNTLLWYIPSIQHPPMILPSWPTPPYDTPLMPNTPYDNPSWPTTPYDTPLLANTPLWYTPSIQHPLWYSPRAQHPLWYMYTALAGSTMLVSVWLLVNNLKIIK